ncbi:hypothetical protein CA85_05330 [Allorhodopirellula solitaria]|uniref:Uncharacterized protein n=2 Tax=Allorhodopirellula solitaria TaxID=2527987 RepID=A0A5C5YK54_9BACT|nr:hypothetical protein CA85_05330 [Allorhodopirellula solitaria]
MEDALNENVLASASASSLASRRLHSEMFFIESQSPMREHLSINAYGASVSRTPGSPLSTQTGGIDDHNTLVSKLTRLDYLTWEDSL